MQDVADRAVPGAREPLYRVEIHDADAKDVHDTKKNPVLFTFKWSRDNGSIVFPIVEITAPESPAAAGDKEIVVTVQLGHLGRDARFGLVANDIVEFVHDALTRQILDDEPVPASGRAPGRSGLLGRVLAPIDRDTMTVRVGVFATDAEIAEIAEGTLHPYLRRWDQKETRERPLWAGAIPVREHDLDTWLPLEDGVEVKFERPAKETKVKALEQRAGDYWMIPARTVTGDVLWPTVETGSATVAALVPPHGPHHHYAPLALFAWSGNAIGEIGTTRRIFLPAAVPEGA